MKFIKNHLMFILPLMAILLGLEFFLVFDRTTKSYEKGLQEGYTMLVVAKKPMNLGEMKSLNGHISSSSQIKREKVISELGSEIGKNGSKEILNLLPYFYNVGIDSFMNTNELMKIKKDLEANQNVKRVETFDSSYGASYRLFTFIKFILRLFIVFTAVLSLFLIIKQMEIWKYAHKERMQVMEIFGAPLMLRSGVLFKVAIIDAFFATIFVSALFFFIKFKWAASSGIEIMMNNQEALFKMSDIAILLVSALLIVVIAVYSVVFLSKKVQG